MMKLKKITALVAAGALAAALFAGAACAAESGVTVEKVKINNNGVTLAGDSTVPRISTRRRNIPRYASRTRGAA